MFADFLITFRESVLPQVLHFIFIAWPIWVPIAAVYVAFLTWLKYIRHAWVKAQGGVFLEVKLPQNVARSPAAMEFVLQGIWENANISTPADAFWEGKMREWFSLEIVSIGGNVHFYIWAFPRWKKIIEARIYAQYPDAEVHEVEDYAMNLHYDPESFYYSAVNTALVKPDAYPINTYIEYELHKKKGDEQEEIVDPITPVLEYLATLKPGEVASFQILIRAHAKENWLYGRLETKKDWQEGIKEEIQKIIEKEALIKPEKDKPPSLLALTDTQKTTIAAIQRNAGKLAFDTMVRLLYVAENSVTDKTRLMGMIGSMRQFGSANMNGIKPIFPFSVTHVWQDFNDIRKSKRFRELIDAYKRRAFFGEPHFHLHGKPYILSTEEVATIYHFPGAVATTPTLNRIPSKKAEAPANLPI